MTIRFIQPWNGYQVGQTATLLEAKKTLLIDGGIARASAENDNDGGTDLQAQISAVKAVTDSVADAYADDAAAATGGVAVGALYNTAGAVKVRAA